MTAGVVFDLLLELEEAGIKQIFTDGNRLFVWPADKLSLRLRTEVRRNRKELMKSNIPKTAGPVLAVTKDVECL